MRELFARLPERGVGAPADLMRLTRCPDCARWPRARLRAPRGSPRGGVMVEINHARQNTVVGRAGEFFVVAPAFRGFNSASRRIVSARVRLLVVGRIAAIVVCRWFRARRPKQPAGRGCYLRHRPSCFKCVRIFLCAAVKASRRIRAGVSQISVSEARVIRVPDIAIFGWGLV